MKPNTIKWLSTFLEASKEGPVSARLGNKAQGYSLTVIVRGHAWQGTEATRMIIEVGNDTVRYNTAVVCNPHAMEATSVQTFLFTFEGKTEAYRGKEYELLEELMKLLEDTEPNPCFHKVAETPEIQL